MKKIAAITMVRNDDFYLRKWVEYYSRELGGKEHLYIYFDGLDQEIAPFCEGTHAEKVEKIGTQVVSAEKGRLKHLSEKAAALLAGGYDAADPNAKAPEGVNPWENCAKYCADAVELAERYLTPGAVANRPRAEKPQEQPSPIVIGAGSGAAGIALGAGAMAVIAYERRRAENEGR